MIENKTLDNAIKAYGEDFNCSYDYVEQAVREKIERDKGCWKCGGLCENEYSLYNDGYANFCPHCGRKLKKG
jgi:hypothetical protein